MQLREITVGRDRNNDIVLDGQCRYASGHHGSFYMDGNQLMFRDRSSNGTLINNIRVFHRAVPVNYGDNVMLAGRYPMNWNQIAGYFPNMPRQDLSQYKTGLTEAYNAPVGGGNNVLMPKDIYKWSWGAFQLYPIWGFFNGCWWGVLVSFLFGWTFVPSIVFGIYGRRWAWANKVWTSVTEFEVTQNEWDKYGLIFFFITIGIVFLYLILEAIGIRIL